MLRNYIAVAFRALVTHRLYSVINIGGLAVGLAACLLIVLYVRDELSYERWLPNADRIAAVETTLNVPGREQIASAGSGEPVKVALEKDFGSDIERAVRMHHSRPIEPVRSGDRPLLLDIAYVDPGFFQVFDLPMVIGQREAALADNTSIILSETDAQKYFGREPAVGKTLTTGKHKAFTVVGVFADVPRNSHLSDLAAIALFDPARHQGNPYIAERWDAVNTRTYVLFRSREAIARVAADLPAFVDRNAILDMPGVTDKPSALLELGLMPLLDIHLHATLPGYANVGDIATVIAFAAVALLVLLIACLNFVNLATARAMKRAREVAMRKVLGSTRGQLIVQHMGEAVITALIALVFALALVELTVGPLGAFVHKPLQLDMAGDPWLLVVSVGLVVAVGVVGGLYPAVYLSRFRPAEVLKANQSSVAGSSRLRTGLVVIQFAVSITLIICTATIFSQTLYARRLDLGFRHDNRLALSVGELHSRATAATLKARVAVLPGVLGASLSSDAPPLELMDNTLVYPSPVPQNDNLAVQFLMVDPSFFGVYGIEPLAGRLFDAARPADFTPDLRDSPPPDAHPSMVINQTMAAKLGVPGPADAVGKVLWVYVPRKRWMMPTTVVGVVRDLYLRSVRTEVTPLMYFARGPEAAFQRLNINVAPGQMDQVLPAIEQVWHQLAPTVPIQIHFVDQDLSAQYDADAQRGQIFAAFALLAVLIACLGLFGLASFAAARRTKEIGVRKVLGASVFDIVKLLVWQFSRPVIAANLIAWPVAFYLMHRWLVGFRYAIELTDPPVFLGIFGGASLLATVIAWLTIAGQSLNVARANPGRALRCE
jgi:putative ABC transport system permease protein